MQDPVHRQAELRRELAALFSAVHDAGEMDTLIEGLLTPGEIEEVSFRWRLMCRLVRGQTQREISRELGVSLGKIARGSRLLKYGLPRFAELIRRVEHLERTGAK